MLVTVKDADARPEEQWPRQGGGDAFFGVVARVLNFSIERPEPEDRKTEARCGHPWRCRCFARPRDPNAVLIKPDKILAVFLLVCGWQGGPVRGGFRGIFTQRAGRVSPLIAQGADTALLILAGLTANGAKLEYLRRFFMQRSPYYVYVPDLPRRRGLKRSASWLGNYLDRELEPGRYRSLHLLGYISGGLLLRQLMFVDDRPLPLDRIVYLRSPCQEYAVARFVQRYGRLVTRLLKGQMMIDITTDEAAALPYPGSRRGQGLVVEEGLSRFAQWMGVSQRRLPEGASSVECLLPDAADVVHVAQSHDEIYTSDDVLALILNFFSSGRFHAGK